MSIDGSSLPIADHVRPALADVFAARFAARPQPTVDVRTEPQPRPVSETLDAGPCRIWLNECQREIDRLRMGLGVDGGHGEGGAHGRESVGFDAGCAPCDDLSEPLAGAGREAKLYSVEPLSQMPDRRHPEPVELPPRIHVLNHYHVTNLGTLLDVLA